MDFLVNLDHQIFLFINQALSNDFFDWIMPLLRNKKTWIPFYLIGAGLLFKYKRKRGLLILLLVLAAVGLADGISSHIFKPLFERTRPCLLIGFADQVNLVLTRCSGAYSFPSSHAANHFAIAFSLILLLKFKQKAYVFLLLFWASIISFAQIYVGVHFPSDIIGGLFIGLIAAFIPYLLYAYYFKE